MNRTSKISSKGQITVPLEIRTRLGPKKGNRIEFVIDNGNTVMRPLRPAVNPFNQFVGCLPALRSKRQIADWISSLRDEGTSD